MRGPGARGAPALTGRGRAVDVVTSWNQDGAALAIDPYSKHVDRFTRLQTVGLRGRPVDFAEGTTALKWRPGTPGAPSNGRPSTPYRQKKRYFEPVGEVRKQSWVGCCPPRGGLRAGGGTPQRADGVLTAGRPGAAAAARRRSRTTL